MKIKPLNDYKLIDFIIKNKKLKAYLVGGCVRDWYLGKKCFDIDVTFSDYPIKIAEEISIKFKFKITEFKNFLTIRLSNDKRKIDFATLRKEEYPTPASLPVVSKAQTINEDLKRRDFTINSIALDLNEKIFEVIDPFKGIKDIKDKKIRILHNQSFIDDPTRIFRAIRFSERFNFEIESHTFDLILKSKEFIKNLSKERIRNEIIKILMEKNCYKMLLKIKELNLLEGMVFFNFDKKIDEFKNLIQRLKYIASKNPGTDFFNYYNFERKIKREVLK